MFKTYAIILSVIAVIAITAPCYGWNQYDAPEPETKTTDGYVVSTHIAEAIIVIKVIDNMDFFVPLDAKITNDVYDISLSDINKGDYVQIEYFIDRAAGKRVVRRLTVEYKKNP